jgi:hypothetical protein
MIDLRAGAPHARIKAEHEEVVVRSLGHEAISFTRLANVMVPRAALGSGVGRFVFIFHGGKVALFSPGHLPRGQKKAPPVDTGGVKVV